MHILVVESNKALGKIWCNHLARQGGTPLLVATELAAIGALRFAPFDALVLDLMLPDASALAICDYASYRLPDITIVIVSTSGFFSDGSFFELIPNARAMLHASVRPDDLAAMVDHYCHS